MASRRSRGTLPFSPGEVGRRLNRQLQAGHWAALSATDLGVLRALVLVADWQTGVIPYSAEQIAQMTRVHKDTVSRVRARLCTAGALVVVWRSSLQVQYALGPALREE